MNEIENLKLDLTETERRLTQIEIKISHQELIIEDLHQVIYSQQADINILIKKFKILEQQIQSDSEIRPAGEKPPHY